MAMWVEMRCDWASKEIPRKRPCFSHVNEGPMEMGSNSLRSMNDTRGHLIKEARRTHWHYHEYEWVCPSCWEARKI
ncbi:MAG: hypothetical protein KGL39_03875 [Patescibacteria group bacterium]|nr:hypothetical protein [Patescibacteria group bacterium]